MKLRESISKEFDEMKEKGVNEKICKLELPKGSKFIKSKKVFKMKCNGFFRVHLVACRWCKSCCVQRDVEGCESYF
jgi:hypothetical protein